jgi:hypothetical protein
MSVVTAEVDFDEFGDLSGGSHHSNRRIRELEERVARLEAALSALVREMEFRGMFPPLS